MSDKEIMTKWFGGKFVGGHILKEEVEKLLEEVRADERAAIRDGVVNLQKVDVCTECWNITHSCKCSVRVCMPFVRLDYVLALLDSPPKEVKG